MSFVLDALKVSEQRRSRFRRRIYAHPPRRRRGARHGWLAALGTLGAVALVALAWRLAAPGPDGGSVPAASGITAGAFAEKPVTENAETLAPAASATATGTVPESAGTGTLSQEAGPARPAWESAREPEMADRVLAAPPPGWPALSLQMLFFSGEEGRSFVQLNGKTYRQGERLPAGPEVLRISGDGVTLTYRGQQVLLGIER